MYLTGNFLDVTAREYTPGALGKSSLSADCGQSCESSSTHRASELLILSKPTSYPKNPFDGF